MKRYNHTFKISDMPTGIQVNRGEAADFTRKLKRW